MRRSAPAATPAEGAGVSGIAARGRRPRRRASPGRSTRALPLHQRGRAMLLRYNEREELEGTAVDSYWGRHTVPRTRLRQSPRIPPQPRVALRPSIRCSASSPGSGRSTTTRSSSITAVDPGTISPDSPYTPARGGLIGVDVSERALGPRRPTAGAPLDRALKLGAAHDGGRRGARFPWRMSPADYAQSLGVIHHASDPGAILRGDPSGPKTGRRAGCVMVYNRDSVVAASLYGVRADDLRGNVPGLDVEEAFARNTDGAECPISRCYRGEEFVGGL